MKLVASLIITKKYFSKSEIKQTIQDIETYVNHVEKLVLLNLSGQSIDFLLEELKRHDNVEEKIGEDNGQVYNYHLALQEAYAAGADFGIILELGYFYDESDLLILKRYAIENPEVAVITPMPIFSCEEPSRQDYKYREIKGCRLVGTLINMIYYKERGFEPKYYQTTFDYEYCLYHRSKGRKVILLVNAIMRNANYRIIEKRFFFVKASTYERDLLDVYYETRNRHCLWEEYKNIDPEYVKLDKKQFKQEKREMWMKDRNYREKKIMIDSGRLDYLCKKMGPRM